jgi:hypothetical protein
VIRPNPVTLQLRYLQTLSEISANQGSTIVFPLPLDVIRPLLEEKRTPDDGNESEPARLQAAAEGSLPAPNREPERRPV